jgi:hypothetical protein
MFRGLQYSKIVALICCLFLFIFTQPVHAAFVNLSLDPSDTNLVADQDFDVQVWLRPGADSSGSISLSSAEFNIFWNSPTILARSSSNPSLGFTDPFGFSYAEWDFSNPTGASHLSATLFSNLTVNSSGLLLMTIPLTAGSTSGLGTIGFDFFMEGIGQNSFWLGNGMGSDPLDLSQVSITNATVQVNAVPIPGALFLFAPGLAGLAVMRRMFWKWIISEA